VQRLEGSEGHAEPVHPSLQGIMDDLDYQI
jgi:hypothetical protein